MRFCITVFLMLVCFEYKAQDFIKLIEDGDFRKAGKKITKKIEKDPNNIELLYFLAVLKYKKGAREFYDLPSAYDTYLAAKLNYTNITDVKTVERLSQIPINFSAFKALSDSICRIAFEYATEINTEKAHIDFLEKYQDAPLSYRQNSISERNRIGFENAVKQNTLESFNSFIQKYPDANQVNEAWKNIHRIEFHIAMDKNTIEALEAFMSKYPNSIQLKEAQNRIYEIAFLHAKGEQTIEAMEAFITKYPSASQKNEAQQIIYDISFEKVKQIDNSEAYKSYLDKYPSSNHKNEALSLFYSKQFSEQTIRGEWESYRDFILSNSGPYIGVAVDSLLNLARQSINPKIWLFCYDHNLGDVEEVVKGYYLQISKDGELSSLEFFKSHFQNHCHLIGSLQDDFALATTAFNLGLSSDKIFSRENLEMSKRLKREGAKSGAITISLMWDNYNDLDLHCIDPFGEEIYFSNKTALSGGQLDVDMNAGGPVSMEPVENIFWDNSNVKNGKYRVLLNHYSNHECGIECSDPTEFTIVVKHNYVFKEFKGKIAYGESKRLIYEFDYSNLEYGQIQMTNENKLKIENYIKNAKGKELAFVALQRLIAYDLDNKSFNAALKKVKEFEEVFLNDTKYVNLVELLAERISQPINIVGIQNINSQNGQEYAPIISADSKKLFFCGFNRFNSLGGEDIFVSERAGQSWAVPHLVTELSNQGTNDALMAISADGNKVLIFENGKLAYRSKTTSGWSDLQYFTSEINNCLWNGDAMFSSDGNALIFASVREEDGFGVNNSHNEFYHASQKYYSDIYISTFQNNEWSTPRNLGPKINTIYAERSPFLHPDMKTLYFASDGHGGMGNLDVFMSTRISDSCWNCWTDPVNLGKQINSTGDDWGYRISTDGTTAFFSKNIDNKNDENIYSISLPSHLRPDIVAKVEGNLKDLNNGPVSAIIRWEDLESNKVIGTAKSDPVTGDYFIILPMGKNYGYFIEDTAYFPISRNLDLRDMANAIEVKNNIIAVTFKEMIENKIPVPMNNLFFEFGKSGLLPSSIPELKRIAHIVTTKNLSVELSGHTDNVGSAAMNQSLSEARAKSVLEFLVNEGVDINRIVSKGYGLHMPVDTNDTEEGRANNRRVEIRLAE